MNWKMASNLFEAKLCPNQNFKFFCPSFDPTHRWQLVIDKYKHSSHILEICNKNKCNEFRIEKKLQYHHLHKSLYIQHLAL